MNWNKLKLMIMTRAGGRKIFFGKGNKKAKVVIIGEAPSREESVQQEPFMGKKGRMLKNVLEETKISRKDVYVTHVIKTRVAIKPSMELIDSWLKILREEMNLVKPEEIIALGRTAKIACLRGAIRPFVTRKTLVQFPANPIRIGKKILEGLKFVFNGVRKRLWKKENISNGLL